MGEIVELPERETGAFKIKREHAIPDVGFPVVVGLLVVMLLWAVNPLLAVALGVGTTLWIGNQEPRAVQKPRNKKKA